MDQTKKFTKHRQTLVKLRSDIIEKFDLEKALLEKENKQTGGDEVDIAAEQRTRDFENLMNQRYKKKLEKIQQALEKIESGDFGICEECGDEISIKRLNALPYATLCIDCQEKNESFNTESRAVKLQSAGFGNED